MKNIVINSHRKGIVCLVSLCYFLQADGQDLETYIQQGYINNPEIRALELRYNIAQEKVNEAYWIPNTEFSAGYFVSEPETRTGAQRARFSARQIVPWFGTVTARANYASALSDAEFVEIGIAKRRLALAIAQSYYRLYEMHAKQLVLQDNIQLLKTYEQLALTSVEVGKASAVDVLRLQIRQNELQQQKDILKEQFIAEQSTFNLLLNREAFSLVTVSDSLYLPSTDFASPSDSLKLHPELLKYDKLYESVAFADALNAADSNPMLGVGLDYIPVSERPEMNFSDNGKDIIMPMVSVSIPIFNNRFRSVTRQNALRQEEISSKKESRLRDLESKLAMAVSARNQARIRYSTQEKNLKQAGDAEEILIKNYETGTIDFNDVLDIQELQLKFGLNKIDALATYFRQAAYVNYFIH